ncbi:polysaccharide biosynthesis protein CapD [Gloeocapsa sp. PCC 7428]|nr:polysaccharide biosynthesis protein CapD [Gloeocapsa sp. PCC 7428]
MVDALSKVWLRLRNRHFFVADAVIFLLTPALALALRLDKLFVFRVYGTDVLIVTAVFLVVKILLLYQFGFYRRCWRYASIDELIQVVASMAAVLVVQTWLFYVLYYTTDLISDLPRSLPLLDGILSLILVGGIRFSVRALERVCQLPKTNQQYERALIVGAGHAGVSMVQTIQHNPKLGLYAVGFIDDDPTKLGLRIRGVRVLGDRHSIPNIIRAFDIERVIIAMPTVSGKMIREIVDRCQSLGVATSTLPSIHEILSGHARAASIRDVKIEDLLRREPIKTNVEAVSHFLNGKRVLITGAGGSIGSEICRQVLQCCPAEILLVGHGENSVFNIQQELQQALETWHRCSTNIPRLTTLIADIRFAARLDYVFEQFKPDIVFHAAAHKHVPLMEANSPEAITNNVVGTKNLLDLALRYNVKHFVMISTDKAVNPTSIMGASKRAAEMLVLKAAQVSKKPFVVVRFGNVLGSRGSVVPTFKRQIAAGGPITITHPDICRYFMTIPEAVQLVLQAAVIGHGGEVFMLNMGEPVKIVDLAKDLIRLSGYEVGKDIDIVYTGLRPGEKLYEELFIPGERYEPTQHEKILSVCNASGIIPENLESMVAALCKAADLNDNQAIVSLLQQLVIEYKPGGSNAAKKSVSDRASFSAKGDRTFRQQNLTQVTSESLQLEKDLKRALMQRELRIHYQPIVNLVTKEITSFEALLRWQHPQHGLIAPAKFINIAEDTGLIVPIGWWVLRQACQQLQLWQQQFPHTRLGLSINLSRQQFFQPDLSERIAQILADVHLAAGSLRLEMAEDAIVEDDEYTSALIRQLTALGVQLQIDNIGVGYSFLSLLLQLPQLLQNKKISRLKLDRTLVSCDDSETAEIMQTITAIAHDLHINVTATGVETTKQLARVKALNCEYAQGYLFSKPLEDSAAGRLLEQQLRYQISHPK